MVGAAAGGGVAAGGGGVAGTTAPVHTTGDASDGSVTWTFVSTSEPISDYARNLGYDLGNNYTVQIIEIHPGSLYIMVALTIFQSPNIFFTIG